MFAFNLLSIIARLAAHLPAHLTTIHLMTRGL
jgi:hypothetical protein